MPQGQNISSSGTARDMMRCVVDGAGNMVFVSPALGWSLGHNAATLTGKPVKSVLDLVSLPGLDKIDSGFYEVSLLPETSAPLNVLARIDRIETPGGKTFVVIWCDPENKLKYRENADMQAAAQDITRIAGNTQSAPASRDGDLDLQNCLDLSDDIFMVCAPDLSVQRANAAFARILGHAPGSKQAKTFTALLHPDDRPRARAALESASNETAERTDFFARAACGDGRLRRIGWSARTANGRLYLTGRDLTALTRQEEALHQREQLISEAQKIGNTGHWRWQARDGGGMQDIMEWSDQVYDIFGVEKDAFIPSVTNVQALVLKRDITRIARSLRRAHVRQKDYAFEFRLRRPDGSVRYARCEGRCKIDPKSGRTVSFFGIVQDITTRTLHEQALRSAKDAAEQAYASKTRFLANMSHELRTPLNAIIGFSEMIQRQLLGPVGNPRYLDYINSIRESGNHLLNLINDILDMSKIEAGKYELNAETLNVGKTMRLAVHMVEGRAHEGQIRLVTEGIEDDIQIRADRRALMQILLNVLSNAVKFTRPGGSIDIRCHRELSGVAIVISDTGIGIPAEKLHAVTRPFEQVDSELTRSYEGSGLGLAITKDLIDLHGGGLEINSEVNVGTTVTVLLPEEPAA